MMLVFSPKVTQMMISSFFVIKFFSVLEFFLRLEGPFQAQQVAP